jgi:response regulator NasT
LPPEQAHVPSRDGLTLKILLADDDASRSDELARSLAAEAGVVVLRMPPGEMLADAVARLAPDVVLVDMTRPDRDALDGLRQVAQPVVLFVDQDDPDFMEEAIGAGVSSYNVGSVQPAQVRAVLRAAVALFRRHEQTRAALTEAERRLREREDVDRAKAMLIRDRRMTEPEAHRWLQRKAMAGGLRLAEVARRLLEGRTP